MASSSSGDRERDQTVPSPPPKPTNPFIKFRDFADAQIGSLLQGIIGLPSAFSREPAENSRWAIFDEDLRRRDELQARQRDLRESEARRLSQRSTNQENNEGEINVKKSADWESWKAPRREDVPPATKANTTSTLKEGLTMDLPLYSPVSKALFAHLNTPADPEVDWKQMDGPSAPWRYLFADPIIDIPLATLSTSDFMGTTQRTVYNHLNSYSDWRSEYSLLPYLMFSPYSPLRLSMPSPQGEQNVPRDDFPYREAFEDLIRITQKGKPLPYFVANNIYPKESNSWQFLVNMDWIDHLYKSKILQEQKVRDQLNVERLPFHPAGGELIHLLQQLNESAKDADTEQEMYDRFLRWASGPHTEASKDKVGTPNRLLSEDSVPELPHSVQELLDVVSSKSIHQWSDIVDKLAKPSKEEQERAQERGKPTLAQLPKNGQMSDRVVSTGTTTEHIRHEDGSVETRVEVWKQFADGRETVTSTTHVDTPTWDNNNDDDDDDQKISPERAKDESTERSENTDNEKKHVKKGWFWN